MAGQPLTYGQMVQLVQVKSGKFLVTTVKAIAELEKHCLKVILAEKGNDVRERADNHDHDQTRR